VDESSIDALRRAISLFSSQEALAERIGVTSQAINGWKKTGNVPWRQALKIHSITRAKVTFSDLCPDIYAAVIESATLRQMDIFSAAAANMTRGRGRKQVRMEAAMT
jgi:DNA-binding transcriptional regulator YdaS (Cro superfamily)